MTWLANHWTVLLSAWLFALALALMIPPKPRTGRNNVCASSASHGALINKPCGHAREIARKALGMKDSDVRDRAEAAPASDRPLVVGGQADDELWRIDSRALAKEIIWLRAEVERLTRIIDTEALNYARQYDEIERLNKQLVGAIECEEECDRLRKALEEIADESVWLRPASYQAIARKALGAWR